MPARKNRPVLYEVAGLSRRQRDGKRRLTTPVTPLAAPPELPPAPPVVEPADRPESESRARTLRLSEGRLELTLGWPGLAIAALGAALVLYVTFQTGQRASRSSPAEAPGPGGSADVSDATGGEPPDAGLVPEHRPAQAVVPPPSRAAGEPRPTPPATPPTPPESKSTFTVQPGHHYLVIQHFRLSAGTAATDAAAFLRSNGVDCVIVRDNDLMLMSTRPFLLEQKNAAQAKAERQACEELKRKILGLGKVYFNELKRGYAFEFCKERKFGPRP